MRRMVTLLAVILECLLGACVTMTLDTFGFGSTRIQCSDHPSDMRPTPMAGKHFEVGRFCAVYSPLADRGKDNLPARCRLQRSQENRSSRTPSNGLRPVCAGACRWSFPPIRTAFPFSSGTAPFRSLIHRIPRSRLSTQRLVRQDRTSLVNVCGTFATGCLIK